METSPPSVVDVHRIAALRQLETHRIVTAFRIVVFAQFCAQPGGLDPYDGVDRGIEGLIAVEYLNADRVTLQTVSVSSECFRDDECEEAPESLRLHERRTDEDLFKATKRLGAFCVSRQPVGADHGKPPLWIPAPICR